MRGGRENVLRLPRSPEMVTLRRHSGARVSRLSVEIQHFFAQTEFCFTFAVHLKGGLAQLVQSICLTSRGSGVRTPQPPQTSVASPMVRVHLYLLPSIWFASMIYLTLLFWIVSSIAGLYALSLEHKYHFEDGRVYDKLRKRFIMITAVMLFHYQRVS